MILWNLKLHKKDVFYKQLHHAFIHILPVNNVAPLLVIPTFTLKLFNEPSQLYLRLNLFPYNCFDMILFHFFRNYLKRFTLVLRYRLNNLRQPLY